MYVLVEKQEISGYLIKYYLHIKNKQKEMHHFAWPTLLGDGLVWASIIAYRLKYQKRVAHLLTTKSCTRITKIHPLKRLEKLAVN